MSEVRICGVHEVPPFIEQFGIKKLMSCLSNYKVVDSAYGFTQSVMSLNPTYWGNQANWLKLNMEDTTNTSEVDAPTTEEVVKGINFGANAIKSGENLLVHCQLGVSRSPAMAIGSMIAAGDTIEQAFAKAKQVRPRIDPNPLIIQIIDEHLKLNGQLTEYNNNFRANTRSALKTEYKKLTEAYMTDTKILGIIFENVSALDRL